MWWYGAGLSQDYQIAVWFLEKITDFFSLPILFKSWFAPWKNDVLTAKNISLGDQVKLWEQNFVSRIVGFFLRTVIISVGVVILALGSMLLTVGTVIWLALPILLLALPIGGVAVYIR